AGTGMSVMEHSHRGKEYEAVHNEAIALMRELLAVPRDYDVLFLQGGASMQFAQIPMNLLQHGATADYVVTGAWGEKAVSEAKSIGAVNGAATTGAGEGKEKSYTRVPEQREIKLSGSPAYVHFTSNETIHGIQFASFPDFGEMPMVSDMSSDFLSRK